ncbi:DUF4349 domain-containing protein [Halobacillus halophilus]|uniref:DUF4349 domain-containing protein n=1 Tax=Halobacillus halophilus (strain ATCC 35676 / DSM 2266 / JCM 20832 / KCTC 3685 / LMG 17431 / NBRC 102448 / NCIMB 2269) TaxID=866895 RepID=I0JKF2_HALH3|nr:DUF4349 domain-containing protein [Halobacillus halophilus]ASF38768.1 DUF4349 domain-containing protein [Halobacillus halophilus]CCG44621.1 conserved hypothetical protein [Halobacillus halophilus DSM 2266]
MVTKILKLALSIMLLLAVSAACSQNEDNSAETSEEASSDSAESNGLSETPSQAENGEENGPARIAQSSEQRMMVYEAHIDVETNNYDQFHQHLQERMNQQDAQMVESTISKNEQGRRQGHIRIRVPQPNFESLLTEIEEISSEVLSRNISGRDVTEEYVDLESRLQAKEKIESRLLTFLEQAEATEDLIKISQDLERVQSEIEGLKGKIKYLENQSDFSTITVSIQETAAGANLNNSPGSIWEETKLAFINSLHYVGQFFSWLIVFFLGYSPFLALIAGVGLLFWLVRRKKKKSSS